jgi:hypothetical protein
MAATPCPTCVWWPRRLLRCVCQCQAAAPGPGKPREARVLCVDWAITESLSSGVVDQEQGGRGRGRGRRAEKDTAPAGRKPATNSILARCRLGLPHGRGHSS